MKMETKRKRFFENRVDAEIILGSMNNMYEITNNPKEADIIIINTIKIAIKHPLTFPDF